MIVDINKVYILSAPPATEGMEDVISSTSPDTTYVKMKRVDTGEVRNYTKLFQYKGMWLQASITVVDLPEKEAVMRLNSKIEAYALQDKKK